MNFVEELRWRGMLQDIMPGTEELLSKEQVTAYLGIDPTADSLHIGHLCGVMILRHFQRCGHKPLALIGGATGMIGDPSGKSAERNLLNEETLRHNQACIKKQLAKFLDFESDVPNRAELVNNYDWMKDFTFLDFAREVGKHITVNYMMAKDSVKRRLNGEARDGLSFTEFTYQLLQGYDFLHLYETKGCKLQMGGSDQWGNITTGAELIRRTNGGEVFALTCPLITKADGGKFGKTESGNIWLDPRYTWGSKQGWGGPHCRQAMVAKFFPNVNDAPSVLEDQMVVAAKDDRALMCGVQRSTSTGDNMSFTDGFACAKFSNIRADNGLTSDTDNPDMDIPLLRMAEAYLIVAEASIRANNGVSTQETIDAMHEIRKRANAAESASYTLTDIRDEWAREFWFEGRRRIDLIRFGDFGGHTDYNWDWKGGEKQGTEIKEFRNIYPIPANDINANTNLEQNPEY